MGDWQELGQAIFIGLVFSFLIAKLISTVISFREDHLKIVREGDLVSPAEAEAEVGNLDGDSRVLDEGESASGEARVSDDEDDDDWEGVESTELDEIFSAATAFVAATAADRNSAKVSNEVQLQLYGLYKIATEGPCTTPQPSALKLSARAKWNAWQRLGAMSPEQAMEKYIDIVSELYPSWADGAARKNRDEGTSHDANASKGPMGPVFSSFVHEEQSDNDLTLEAVHVYAREGEADNLHRLIEDGVSVNLRDSEGRTPLHWAVDRGHFNVVELLLNINADVNAKDNEGQTPLHYAALCEREAIAELLVKHSADPDMKDEDGNSPSDLCSSTWAFIGSVK